MKHYQKWARRLLTGGGALLLAGGLAIAQEESGSRGNLPASSAGSTTTTAGQQGPTNDGETQHAGLSRDGNMPASSTKNVSGDTANVPPPNAPRSDVGLEAAGAPDPAVRPGGWQMGAEGTLIQLEELAPVEIIDLQERLHALNLYEAKIDGIPGPRTRQALREYFLKQARFASQGQLDASALDLFDVAPAGRSQGL